MRESDGTLHNLMLVSFEYGICSTAKVLESSVTSSEESVSDSELLHDRPRP